MHTIYTYYEDVYHVDLHTSDCIITKIHKDVNLTDVYFLKHYLSLQEKKKSNLMSSQLIHILARDVIARTIYTLFFSLMCVVAQVQEVGVQKPHTSLHIIMKRKQEKNKEMEQQGGNL